MISYSIQHIPHLLCKNGHFWGAGWLHILGWETTQFFNIYNLNVGFNILKKRLNIFFSVQSPIFSAVAVVHEK